MATFDPQFAHATLLVLAEAAYVADSTQLQLPQNYSVVGQITVNPTVVASLAAAAGALGLHADLVAKMRPTGDVFGWVVQNSKNQTVVVTFRGTSDVNDWLHDFDFLPEAYKPVANYGTVHQGFQCLYLSVRDSVRSLVQKTKGSCQRLILTGHSLGSALSELAAPDILHNSGLGVPPEVQNFAGPRVGHHDFANVFDVEIDVCFRVVNIWDIVPKVPPPLALFEHVGLAVNVDGGFTLDELTAHSLDKSYGPGLKNLIPQPGAQPAALTATTSATIALPNHLLIGREP